MVGGGGGGSSVNDVSTSQAELWKQQAEKWNKYIVDIEPRQNAAFKSALADPSLQMEGAVKSAIYDKYSPNKAFENPKALNTQKFLQGESELGGALAMSGVSAREAAKDYKANTISNILAAKMGENPAIQKGLTSTSALEANTIADTYNTNRAIDFGENQAASANVGSALAGAYTGVRDQQVKSETPKK
jgi:hypothetical protein